MSDQTVRAAFESRLKTWAEAQSPPIPVAWENAKFTPPTTRYLRAFVLPAPTISRDIGRVNRQRKGVFQVTIVLPTGAGVGAAQTIIDGLSSTFAINAPLAQSGLFVWLTRPFSPGPAIQDSDRLAIPVSAEYSCDTY